MNDESTPAADTAPETHYVLIIHGTWNPPKAEKPRWYELDPESPENFCTQLNQRLARGELGAAVWRPYPNGKGKTVPLSFSWSGENEHSERLAAAERLVERLSELGRSDPSARIHLVAHSHGGNVVLKALELLEATRTETLRLGRIVLMGTPFYVKKWSSSCCLGGCLPMLTVVVGLVYLLALGFSAFLAPLPGIDFVGWQPWAWPWWFWGMVLLMLFFSISLTFRGPTHRDVNLYFDTEVFRRRRFPHRVLVISAGWLDEAFLALSAEPLVFATAVPVIDRVIRPQPLLRVSPLGTGVEENALRVKVNRAFASVLYLGLNAVRWPLYYLPLTLARRPLKRFVTKKFLEVCTTLGFGVEPRELDQAHITVKRHLESKRWVVNVSNWDIEELLASTPARRPVNEAPRRYDYLWDEESLDARLEKSVTWPRLKERLDLVRERYAGRELSERDLQRLCLTVDVRLRRFAGMIELLHSSYYTHPEVIDAIASFLERGTGPKGSTLSPIP